MAHSQAAAGVPDRFIRKHMYLDFTGHKRNRNGMEPFTKEIVPSFLSIREQGLNMIDATQLHQLGSSVAATAEPIQIAS